MPIRYPDSAFQNWAKPSSDAEDEKRDNAIRAVRGAVAAHRGLSARNVTVLAHGSYANNTEVRQESDVDIFVVCPEPFFSDFTFAQGFTREDTGIVDSSYKYSDFKNEVHEALVNRFGQRAVSSGSKAFDVHENTYRVDADVVACLRHRLYTTRDNTGGFNYLSGVQFIADDGKRIINWPEQHYKNGVAKNDRTRTHFKHLVRIIKRLRYAMEDAHFSEATSIPSFLIECLVWNVPDEGFLHSRFTDDVRYVLAHLWQATRNPESCKDWKEISELKWLFRASQTWTVEQVHAFIYAAWNHIGFE